MAYLPVSDTVRPPVRTWITFQIIKCNAFNTCEGMSLARLQIQSFLDRI